MTGNYGLTAKLITAAAILVLFLFNKSSVYAAVYTVSQDGTGDFQTIQEAVNAAADNDTIAIRNGIYNEAVLVIGKTLNLAGSGAGSCVITHKTDNYMLVPLFIQSGSVKNLTVKGYGSTNGYTVHIDHPYQKWKTLTFENCSIVANGLKNCLGIGMYGGSNIYFKKCSFTSDIGFLFYHNNNTDKYPGPSSINFSGCTINSMGDTYIAEQKFPTNNSVTLNMTGNTVSAKPAPPVAAPAVPAVTEASKDKKRRIIKAMLLRR